MMLASIQWIGRQPLVSAIESSIVSPSEFASSACQPERVIQDGSQTTAIIASAPAFVKAATRRRMYIAGGT
jgi:hypothetical protein